MLTREDYKQAACKGMDLEQFYPGAPAIVKNSRGRSVSRSIHVIEADTARRVCHGMRCPILQKCLDHALEVGESGVWGGTTSKSRRSLKRLSKNKEPYKQKA